MYDDRVNELNYEQRAMVPTALVEGSRVHPTARTVGCFEGTAQRLSADAGSRSVDYIKLTVRRLPLTGVVTDEMWSCIGNKAATKAKGGVGLGDAWIWLPSTLT